MISTSMLFVILLSASQNDDPAVVDTDLMSTFGRVRSSHESKNAPEPSTQHPDSASEDANRNAWKEDIEALYKEAESAHHIG